MATSPRRQPWRRTPDGPRTFATTLRENVPMTPDVPRAHAALDSGRHPTLTRAARGVGARPRHRRLCRAAQARAARGAAPCRTTTTWHALIDAMYRSVTSTRHGARARSRRAASTLSRDARANRASARRSALVAARARRQHDGDGVEFSAEAHGEGIGGPVGARTASCLINAGRCPRFVPAAGDWSPPAARHHDRPPDRVRAVRHAARADRRRRDRRAGGGARLPVRRRRRGRASPARHPPRPYTATRSFHADGGVRGARRRHARAAWWRAGSSTSRPRVERRRAPDERRARSTVRLRRWSHMAPSGLVQRRRARATCTTAASTC